MVLVLLQLTTRLLVYIQHRALQVEKEMVQRAQPSLQLQSEQQVVLVKVQAHQMVYIQHLEAQMVQDLVVQRHPLLQLSSEPLLEPELETQAIRLSIQISEVPLALVLQPLEIPLLVYILTCVLRQVLELAVLVTQHCMGLCAQQLLPVVQLLRMKRLVCTLLQEMQVEMETVLNHQHNCSQSSELHLALVKVLKQRQNFGLHQMRHEVLVVQPLETWH
jgi:hypothetical protein